MLSYDVVVVGGSIAGLLTAREVSKHGYKVLVLEEDQEIGTPEHCGGLVSLRALLELGVVPDGIILERIKSAKIYSPSNKVIELQAKGIVSIDRRRLDKQLAKQAITNGSEISLLESMLEYKEEENNVIVKSNKNTINTKILVDARGCKVIMLKDSKGALPSLQYEVVRDSIEDKVEVYLDNERYNGFFGWVIPNRDYLKVGVAGRNVNLLKSIEHILPKPYLTLKRIHAPIWINGPLDRFVNGRIVRVGDAAGQTKPTTGGGIYSCGMGGIFAGKAIVRALDNNDLGLLKEYETNWFKKFGKEFESMLLIRRIFERLDNKALDEIFDAIDDSIVEDITNTDFDFHSSALLRIIGIGKVLNIVKSIVESEIRRLFR